MKSGKIFWHLWIAFIGLNIFSGKAQIDIKDFIKKYQDYPGFYLNRELDIEIDIKNGNPVAEHNVLETIYVLSNNASYFNEGRQYFSKSLILNDLKAYTQYPENNKYKKVNVKDFKKITEHSSGLYLDDTYLFSYNYPNVIKGSKLITEVKTTNKDPFRPIIFYFGGSLPTKKAELRLSCPNHMVIRSKLYGMDTTKIKYSKHEKGGYTQHIWKATDLKDYDSDELSPGIRYIFPHIAITIAHYDYQGIQRNVLGSIEDQYNWTVNKVSNINKTTSHAIKTLSDSICQGLNIEEKKVAEIYKWVQNNIRYVAIEDGQNGYIPRDAKLVLQRRYGDCKDKTSLIYALLKAQEIPAAYVWVGSRDLPYKYTELPSLNVDNHMVAAWWKNNETPVILDGTTQFHDLYDIPAFIQGKECLIHKNENEFLIYNIPSSDSESNIFYDSLNIKFNGDTLTGDAYAKFTGEYKAMMRDKFYGKNPEKYPFIVASEIPKASNKFIVNEVVPGDIKEGNEMNINYSFTIPDFIYVSHESGNVYLNMNINRNFQDYDFKKDRKIPLEAIVKSKYISITVFDLPEEYQIELIPENTSFKQKEFSFNTTYKHEGNRLVMKNEIIINFLTLNDDKIPQFHDMLKSLKKSYLNTIILKKL